MSDRVTAVYLMETASDVARAAEVVAGEQSSGTFVKLPGESPELLERAGARVEAIEPLEAVDTPSLPGAQPGMHYRRARVTLSWPVANFGHSLPNLMATVAGNLFELAPLSGLRILDIALPDAFMADCPGPAFGIGGTRALASVAEGPLIGTIVKPSVGLGPAETAALIAPLVAAGIDFIKDDELQADGPHCPFDARVDAVMRVIDDHAQRTGRKTMYAFNLTGEVDEMKRRHDHVLARGGTCVMASLNSIGLAGLLALRRHAELPIHAHRNGWGYLSRHPMLGWSYVAWHKLWRLAGADHMHVNGIANKFSEPDDSVIESARACLAPLSPAHPALVMPVFSSGQTVRQAAPTWAALGSADLIHAAGGGIMAHPDGPAAGVEALRLAWQAAMAGTPVDEHATQHPALASALATFKA